MKTDRPRNWPIDFKRGPSEHDFVEEIIAGDGYDLGLSDCRMCGEPFLGPYHRANKKRCQICVNLIIFGATLGGKK